MNKYVLILLLLAGSAVEAAKIRCLCVDKTAVFPECGICGLTSGTMNETGSGVECICSNKLKLKNISCAETCKDNGGWTGEFS